MEAMDGDEIIGFVKHALSIELWLRRGKPAGGQYIPPPAGLPPERPFFDPRGLAPRVKQFRQTRREGKRETKADKFARGEVVPVFPRTRPSSFSLPTLSRNFGSGGASPPGANTTPPPAGLQPERPFSDPRGLAPRVKQFRQRRAESEKKKRMELREAKS